MPLIAVVILIWKGASSNTTNNTLVNINCLMCHKYHKETCTWNLTIVAISFLLRTSFEKKI